MFSMDYEFVYKCLNSIERRELEDEINANIDAMKYNVDNTDKSVEYSFDRIGVDTVRMVAKVYGFNPISFIGTYVTYSKPDTYLHLNHECVKATPQTWLYFFSALAEQVNADSKDTKIND